MLDWAIWVNMTILGMIIVESWLAYIQCTKAKETQKEFYTYLAEELIDNTYDSLIRSGRQTWPTNQTPSPVLATATGRPRSGVYAHLTPTKLKRKGTNSLLQSICHKCQMKTTYICSQFNDDVNIEKDVWICHTKTQ